MKHALYDAVSAKVREKRNYQPHNMRIEWPSSNRLILRWDYPPNGRPSSYRLTYIGMRVSSGSVLLTKYVTDHRVSGSDTSVELSATTDDG